MVDPVDEDAVHDLEVVTLNKRDFDAADVSILDPLEGHGAGFGLV